MYTIIQSLITVCKIYHGIAEKVLKYSPAMILNTLMFSAYRSTALGAKCRLFIYVVGFIYTDNRLHPMHSQMSVTAF